MTTGRINQVNIFFGVRKHKTRFIKLVAHSTATYIAVKYTIRLIRILISLSLNKERYNQIIETYISTMKMTITIISHCNHHFHSVQFHSTKLNELSQTGHRSTFQTGEYALEVSLETHLTATATRFNLTDRKKSTIPTYEVLFLTRSHTAEAGANCRSQHKAHHEY